MNGKGTVRAALLCAAVVWVSALRAQDDFRALTRRLDSLERVVGACGTGSPAPVAAARKDLFARHRLSGYLQLLYHWNGDASSFSVYRVRLDLQGPILRDRIEYRVQAELASPVLLDAYIRFTPLRQLNVQAGQFKIPFSIENIDYPPLRQQTIEYPLVLRRLMGFDDVCGMKATGRDIGLMAYGGFFARDGYTVVNYRVGVFNGSGINCKDDNKSKDISAYLAVTPLRGLDLVGSWYRGEYGPEHLGRLRWGAGAAYNGRLFARAEYIRGKTGALRSDGGYVTAGFFVRPFIAPVVRFDAFRGDVRRGSSVQRDYLLGIDYRPLKYLRLQADYTYRTCAAPAGNSSSVQVMLSGIF